MTWGFVLPSLLIQAAVRRTEDIMQNCCVEYNLVSRINRSFAKHFQTRLLTLARF